MSKEYSSNLRLEIISKNATKDEITDILRELTDEDFNGNNGEDYFVEIDGEEMSRLDACMLDYNSGDNLEALIRHILSDNYSDNYYDDYSYNIKDIGDSLVIALAFI